MKKILITSLILGAGIASAQTVNNWQSSSGPVRNSFGQCWRTSSWTPATAHTDCDGALKPVPTPVVEAPKSVVTPAAPAPKVEPAVPVVTKNTYSTDTFFDFDKSVLKPEGRAKLDDLINKMKSISLEVVIVVGHTDSVGSDAYNMKLGLRRAEAVKAYLISKGIEKQRVFTDSKGERQPVADNKTREGRAKNRRVEIEVVGTTKR